MKKALIVQARMGSSRLPGKVAKYLNGQPVLSHILNRIKKCSLVDDIIVATTQNKQDIIIQEMAHQAAVKCYCGSEDDVLSRFYFAANQNKSTLIIRICSDCPFIDPYLIDKMIETFSSYVSKSISVDYLSNTLKRTYPRGLDTEIFTFEALQNAYTHATQQHEREHVTPYLYKNHFSVKNYTRNTDLTALRWTLDTSADWLFFESISKYISPEQMDSITTEEILTILEQYPHLSKINSKIVQKTLLET